MRMYGCTALLALASMLSAEWVPVPVIDRQSDKKKPAPQDVREWDGHQPVAAVGQIGAAPEDIDPMVGEADRLALHDIQEAHLELLRQSKEPVSGKLYFLQQLHDRLLRHVAALVPQTVSSFVRSSRDVESEGRGHKGIGFPSNEGTLLSLCFLVFAVFLVKVVMQLIYAVQNSQATTAAPAGVRVAQMPDGMLPGAMGMGTMMNMVPAMMQPMVGAADAAAAAGGGARSRARRSYAHPDMDRAARTVMEAIGRAHTRFAWFEWNSDNH